MVFIRCGGIVCSIVLGGQQYSGGLPPDGMKSLVDFACSYVGNGGIKVKGGKNLYYQNRNVHWKRFTFYLLIQEISARFFTSNDLQYTVLNGLSTTNLANETTAD